MIRAKNTSEGFLNFLGIILLMISAGYIIQQLTFYFK